ncbi:MAG: hypothetical protein WCI27_03140 [Candidatus Omnitrophota bacterium]
MKRGLRLIFMETSTLQQITRRITASLVLVAFVMTSVTSSSGLAHARLSPAIISIQPVC